MYDELHDLLTQTDGILEGSRWHPERDVLFHQLQTFELARAQTSDRALWAAALLHDVGKAVAFTDHAEIGADLLDGLIAPRVVWLVRHHFDLISHPRATRRRLQGTTALRDLMLLRRWDEGGRRPHVQVMDLEDALGILLDGSEASLLDPAAGPPANDAYEKESWG